jgi:rSAM/selenodomain-associated transferase 2
MNMVSIIIPLLNEEKAIPALMNNLAVQEGKYEIIMVDGGSTDQSLEICKNYNSLTVLTSEKGRANQMNKGAAVARGEILLFLHADTLLPLGGIKSIEAAMEDDDTVGGSFYMKFDMDKFTFRFFSVFTRINSAYLTYGDQGIFIKKSVFEDIGAFKQLPILEDFEIQKRLRKKGRFIKLPLPVTTSARRFLHKGIFKQQFLNIALLCAYELGYSPVKIKAFYKDTIH